MRDSTSRAMRLYSPSTFRRRMRDCRTSQPASNLQMSSSCSSWRRVTKKWSVWGQKFTMSIVLPISRIMSRLESTRRWSTGYVQVNCTWSSTWISFLTFAGHDQRSLEFLWTWSIWWLCRYTYLTYLFNTNSECNFVSYYPWVEDVCGSLASFIPLSCIASNLLP